jgi:putative salt-induced outer membrane protein YdiY
MSRYKFIAFSIVPPPSLPDMVAVYSSTATPAMQQRYSHRPSAVASLCVAIAVLLSGTAAGQDPPAIIPLPPLDAATSILPPPALPAAPAETVAPAAELSASDAFDGDSDAPSMDVSAPVVAEHVWYEPGFWIRPTAWDGGVEVGLTGTDGNSQTLSFAVGANVKRKTDTSDVLVQLNYVKASADSVETANNAFLKGRYEWLLGDSPWKPFVNGTLEYDEFRAFDLRLAGNGGIGYQLFDTDSSNLTGRFGSGVSHELGGPDDSYVPEAVYGLEFEYQLTSRQKVSAQTTYYPSWEDYSDYRIVTVVNWSILLDEATNLSLKLTGNDRYDSTPHGSKPNDLNYALVLVWEL